MGVSRTHSFVDAIADQIPGVNMGNLELLYKEIGRKFREMNLKNINRKEPANGGTSGPMLEKLDKRPAIKA
jgi:hypothetical protein